MADCEEEDHKKNGHRRVQEDRCQESHFKKKGHKEEDRGHQEKDLRSLRRVHNAISATSPPSAHRRLNGTTIKAGYRD